MYAVGGELNGGPPVAGSLLVGNSKHIRLPCGAGASNCDIRIAQSGRMAGFIAQKNWVANNGQRRGAVPGCAFLPCSRKSNQNA